MNHIISIEHFLKVKSHYRYRMLSQGQTILSLQNILPRSNLIISTKHFTKVKPHYFYKMFSQGQTSISLQNILSRSNHIISTHGQTSLSLQNVFPRSNHIISTKPFLKVEPHYLYETFFQEWKSIFRRSNISSKHSLKVKQFHKVEPCPFCFVRLVDIGGIVDHPCL